MDDAGDRAYGYSIRNLSEKCKKPILQSVGK